MLIRFQTLQGIREGTIDLAFRRQKRPTVKTGGRLRTRIGELSIDSVEPVTMKSITAADARRAGYPRREDLLAELRARPGSVYRIELHLAGPDARVALRERTDVSAEEAREIAARLARMDARSATGPWTADALAMICRHPARRASDVAAELGVERRLFKNRVRRLKELGLTRSLAVGYELSPRGQAFVRQRR